LTEIKPGVLPRNADAAAWTTASTPLPVESLPVEPLHIEQRPLPLHLPPIPAQLPAIPRDFTVTFRLPLKDAPT
jgi:hypothetical protein